MADIFCQTCDEPWDTHHLRYDAIHETGLTEARCRTFTGRLTTSLRRHFSAAGYQFGASIYSLRSCPCCPEGAKRSERGKQRGLLADAAAGVLGADLDGILGEILCLSEEP